MQKKNEEKLIFKIATVIVDRRKIVFFLLAAVLVFCAFSRNWVNICDDITEYLPDNTETKQGLRIMNENFTTFATADVMADNVTLEMAEAMKEEIENIEGVKSVTFDETPEHFSGDAALFSVTFDGLNDDNISISALNEIKTILDGRDVYIQSDIGNPLKAIIDSEMIIVYIVVVVVVLSALILTSRTYAEVLVLLMTFGCAAVLNMGTNFIFGTVSFITDSIAIVLQLALAIDYAIILLHHFQEQRETHDKRDAAVIALSRAIPEISASSMTTIAGLAAMCLMQFRLGPDMGIVLIKAILLSLLSVFTLMPGLLVAFSDLMDKTKHKNFVPKINAVGRFAYVSRYVMPILFVFLIVAGCIFSHKVQYAYSEDSISSSKVNATDIAKEKIKSTFGLSNPMVIIVPSGDYGREERMIAEIVSLEGTKSVTGLANVEVQDGYTLTAALTPREFSELAGLDYEVVAALYAAYALNEEDYGQAVTNLDNYSVPLIDFFSFLIDKEKEVDIDLDDETRELLDDLDGQLADARLQLMNNGYSRIVVDTELDAESDESLRYLNMLHGLVEKYYSELYITGNTQSNYDLKHSFEKDNLLMGILTVVFVVIVLVFTFNSAGLPMLLISIIQGSVWINFSVPYFTGEYLFFMTYLIVSSIQMGANIDYAIVISSRYMELKKEKHIKEAMTEALNFAFPTIVTSGSILAAAGLALCFLSSEKTIATIGRFLGQGTLLSIFLVMFVLPQILLLGDLLINKTSFSISNPIQIQQKSGLMKVNGRIRGNFNGFIDAEVHGVIRGDLNAMIDLGKLEEVDNENS